MSIGFWVGIEEIEEAEKLLQDGEM